MIKKNETEREEETQRILSLLRNERNRIQKAFYNMQKFRLRYPLNIP